MNIIFQEKNFENFSVENILNLKNIVILENVDLTDEQIAKLKFKEAVTKDENRKKISMMTKNVSIDYQNLIRYSKKIYIYLKNMTAEKIV